MNCNSQQPINSTVPIFIFTPSIFQMPKLQCTNQGSLFYLYHIQFITGRRVSNCNAVLCQGLSFFFCFKWWGYLLLFGGRMIRCHITIHRVNFLEPLLLLFLLSPEMDLKVKILMQVIYWKDTEGIRLVLICILLVFFPEIDDFF